VPFHPDYVRLVLDENFEDAKALFLRPLMAIEYAHLAMLVERELVPRDDARKIRAALDAIDLDAIRCVRYDGSYEDLFFYLERQVSAACGDDIAGHLHTARSRNDIDMTLYRMLVRTWLLSLTDGLLELRAVLIELAGSHRDTIFPAHTHTQPAQPTTLGHYFLAAIEQAERDTIRLLAAFATVNRNPLGACAITGTGFAIDRARTSALLGFSGPTGNTYGSIAAADYLLESAAGAQVALVGLGRLVQDLLLWCTREVGYLRLPDGLVQTSSIMPQKRNPVPLEHARALASKAFGQALAIPIAVHNTPFGDIVDTEDDLQPLVATMFKDANRAVRLVAMALGAAQFDVARMRERATCGWVTVTELADALARDHGLSFRMAHAVATAVVSRVGESSTATGTSIADAIAAASQTLSGREIRLSDAELARVLSPEHFVAVRRTWGGPAPEIVAAATDAASAALEGDRAKIARVREQITASAVELKSAVAAI
jgi:argininosuccinate lyase